MASYSPVWNLFSATTREGHPAFWTALLEYAIRLYMEVDAVGYPNEHIAVGDTVVLGHARADAVISWVDYGLEVTGRVNPVFDGAPSDIGCAGEQGKVVTETVGVIGLGSGLAFLQGVKAITKSLCRASMWLLIAVCEIDGPL